MAPSLETWYGLWQFPCWTMASKSRIFPSELRLMKAWPRRDQFRILVIFEWFKGWFLCWLLGDHHFLWWLYRKSSVKHRSSVGHWPLLRFWCLFDDTVLIWSALTRWQRILLSQCKKQHNALQNVGRASLSPNPINGTRKRFLLTSFVLSILLMFVFLYLSITIL